MRGAVICSASQRLPLETYNNAVPPDVPRWGAQYKDWLSKNLNRYMQVLNVTEDKYFAIFLCEQTERRDKFLPDFLALKRFRRNLSPVRKVARRVRAILVFLIFDRSHNFEMTLS